MSWFATPGLKNTGARHLMSSSIQNLTEEGDIGLLFPDLQLSIRNSPGAHGFSFCDTAGVPLMSLGEPTNSSGHGKGSPSLLDLRFLSSPRDIRPIGGLPERVAPPKQVAWPGKAFFPVVLRCVSPSQRYLGSWGMLITAHSQGCLFISMGLTVLPTQEIAVGLDWGNCLHEEGGKKVCSHHSYST